MSVTELKPTEWIIKSYDSDVLTVTRLEPVEINVPKVLYEISQELNINWDYHHDGFINEFNLGSYEFDCIFGFHIGTIFDDYFDKIKEYDPELLNKQYEWLSPRKFLDLVKNHGKENIGEILKNWPECTK